MAPAGPRMSLALVFTSAVKDKNNKNYAIYLSSPDVASWTT